MVELLTGFVVGALAAYLVLNAGMKRKQQVVSAEAGNLRQSVRRSEAEAAKLRRELSALKSKNKAERESILMFPEIIKQIFSGRSSEEVAASLNRACKHLLGAEQSAVFLADRIGARLGLLAAEGYDDLLDRPVNLAVGDGFVGFAAETGRILSRDDLEKQSVLARRSLIMTDIPAFKPDYAAPMKTNETLYGVLATGPFTEAVSFRREIMKTIAAVGAAALENVRPLEKYSRTSNLDPQTGFYRESALVPILENELERVERFGNPLAVIELRIRAVQSSDRKSSDGIMGVVAKYLSASLRNTDSAVRTGMDALVLLLPGTDEEGMKSVTGKLGGEIPLLALQNGKTVGFTGISGMVVRGASRTDAKDLIERLGELEQMEFEGYYGS